MSTSATGRSVRSVREKVKSVSESQSPAVTRSASGAAAEGISMDRTFNPLDLEQRLTGRIESLFADLRAELSAMFADMMEKLSTRVTNLEAQLGSAQKTLSAFETRCADLDSRVVALETRLLDSQQHCPMVDGAYDDLYRIDRLSDVVIRGVPFRSGEDVKEIVRCIAGEIGHPLSAHFEAFRVGGVTKAKSIIVKLSCRNESRAFISSFLKAGEFTLSRVRGFEGGGRVHVGESLSPGRGRTLREAIRLRSAGRISGAFSRNGFVFIKSGPDDKPVKIESIEALHELISRDSSGANATI